MRANIPISPVKTEDFDLQRYERGQEHFLNLDPGGLAAGITLPLLLARGKRPGKVLVALAGVHGDEYEGVRTLLDTFAEMDVSRMAGDFLAVPVANAPAFWAHQRMSPLDGADLARSMPGDRTSGPTRALADCLASAIISRADFLLDLHSAGINLLMPTMVGYDALDPRSQQAALEFGTPVMWGHREIAPGRTISVARDLGIPWLYTEAQGGGRIDGEDLRLFRQGVRNLLCHLSILSERPVKAPLKYHLSGEGNIDASILAKDSGFLIPSVNLLQEVRAGDELGRLVGLHGETIQIFRAPSDGIVALMRALPVVEAGDKMFLLAELVR